MILALATALVCAQTNTEAARAPTVNDFAFGARVEADTERSMQRLTVPDELYDVLTTPDLRDIAVFNAAGEQVPHALRRLEGQEARIADKALPVFPIKAAEERSAASLALTVQRDQNGSIVELRTQEGVAARGEHLVAYLVDSGWLDRPMRALTFVWDDEDASFVQTITVEKSEDLTSWSPVIDNVTLARLLHDGHRIERQRVEFPPVQARYLRLTWSGPPPPTGLNNVVANLAADLGEPSRSWRDFGVATTVEPHTYRVSSSGVRPVDRVRITPHATNTLAQVTLSSAPHADGPWSTRFTGMIYRLAVDGREVASPSITVDGVTDPVWQVEASPQGGGLGGAPSIAVGWIPHELVFIARGDGPFTLAYGSADVRIPAFDANQVLQIAKDERGDPAPAMARILEARVPLGGEARLQPTPPVEKGRGKTLVLWISLVFTVGILAFMSLRLFKQMGAAA